MISFLTYLVEASVCLALFHLLYKVAFEHSTYFSLNRAYLLLSVILSCTIPFLEIPALPASSGLQFPTDAVVLNLPEVVVGEYQRIGDTLNSNGSFIFWLGGVVLAGVLTKGLLTFFRIRKIISVIRTSKTIGRSPNGYTVLKPLNLETVGSFLNYVLVNPSEDLNDNEVDLMVRHEEIHLIQYHTIDILFVELIAILFWFNPFIYSIKRSLEEVHEYIADQEASVRDPQGYRNLVIQSVVLRHIRLMNSFSKCQTIKRIAMLTKKNHVAGVRYIATVPLILLLVLTFSCESPEIAQTQESVPQNEPATSEGVETSEQIFTIVDEMPSPVNGTIRELIEDYLIPNLNYPQNAIENRVEGRVFVQFVVRSTGEITDVLAIRGIGFGCDQEAERVISSMENWIPGKHKGRNVSIRMVLPVTFKISN